MLFRSLSVTDVAANSGDSQTLTASTGAVIDATPGITVSIGGTAQQGQTLSAVVSGAESDDTLSYAWIDNNITVGSGSSYVVQPSDVGQSITLSVTDVADNSGGSTPVVMAGYGHRFLDRNAGVHKPARDGVPKPMRGILRRDTGFVAIAAKSAA